MKLSTNLNQKDEILTKLKLLNTKISSLKYNSYNKDFLREESY